MKCLFRWASLALVLVGVGVGTAHAQPTLPAVEVTASTSDGGSVSIPFFAKATGPLSPYIKVGQDGDTTVNMTKSQFCSALAGLKPSNCSTSTYPPAPGIPSASGATWSGNGCGAGPWSTAFASGALSAMFGSRYSGDLNHPVAGNPSIDFTNICNQHDRDYTSLVSKLQADNNFSSRLSSFCGGSSDPTSCQSFANAYVNAVSNFGTGAYQADQTQLQCAAWGDSMKKSGCPG